MSTDERVGENVTKTIYVPSEGTHAFYAGNQTYTGVAGETILEQVTSEKVALPGLVWAPPRCCGIIGER